MQEKGKTSKINLFSYKNIFHLAKNKTQMHFLCMVVDVFLYYHTETTDRINVILKSSMVPRVIIFRQIKLLIIQYKYPNTHQFGT